MSKNSIIPFLKDYLINFLTSPFLLDTNDIGYKTQKLAVKPNLGQIVMREDTEVLEEVVVTALGIKRSEKALSYNVQQVKGDELTTVKDANFMNALAGKVAGVNINASASGVGGATRVIMRGVKSSKLPKLAY